MQCFNLERGVPSKGDVKDSEKLVSIILNQAVDILLMFGSGEIIDGDSLHGYSIEDPSGLADLLVKSRSLVSYVDSFVLRNKADKITEVKCIGQYHQSKLERFYGHLCYASGLLDTITSECNWKKMPQRITKKSEVVAIAVAIFEARELTDYCVYA